MKRRYHKAAAAVLGAVLAMQSIPLTSGVQAAEGDLLVTGFEDGDVSAFSKRGDSDTSVIAACTTDSHSGDSCMSVTERSQGWNGPSISLADLGCEPGVQYLATAWVKMKWYNSCALSIQYTDAEGVDHYDNLAKVTSDGSWVQIPLTKFSFDASMKNVSIYIEGQDSADMFVDDFSLTTAPVYPIETDIPGLKDVYADYFKIGGAVTAAELSPNSTKDLVLKHYNSLTLGNELKPENMLDQKGTLEYYEETGDNTTPKVRLNGRARIILDFCREHDIPVRGHVLVWYSQTPIWFFTEDYTEKGELVDKDTMLKRMEAYIKGVFDCLNEEYPDIDFYAWDVVNEAMKDGGTPRDPGKNENYNGTSAWVKIFGDNSFIEPAFKYARKYAPANTKLYYNDFNEYMKVDAMIDLAKDLHSKGLLDGLGLQSHLDVTNNSTPDPFPTVQQYAYALDKFCAAAKENDFDIQITELDATYAHSVANGEKLQEQYYDGIMEAIAKNKDQISAVVFWGTTDDQSWRSDRTPLLFDETYKAKPCFYAITDNIDYVEPQQTTTPKVTTTTLPQNKDFLRGDVNCDKDVDVSDAVLLARFLAEDSEATVTDAGLLNADANADKKTDQKDVTKILAVLAKLETMPE